MMNQALRTARIATNDSKKIKKVLDEVGDMIKDIPMYNTPVQSGALVYKKIRDITGIRDPYRDIKKNSIKEALSLYPTLNKLINESDNKSLTAIRIAITGNIIDLISDGSSFFPPNLSLFLEVIAS